MPCGDESLKDGGKAQCSLKSAQRRRLTSVLRGCAWQHTGAADGRLAARRSITRPGAASATGEFPFITVAGTSFEMGQQHGSQARAIIHRYIDYILAGSTKTREEMLADAMEFVAPIDALSPSYILETHGLAEGAGISFAEAMLCQTRGALPYPSDSDRSMEEAATDTYRRASCTTRVGPVADHCTAFALCGTATRDGAPITGQNQDVSLDMDKFGLVIRLRPADDRPAALMFTWAGQLGYHGLNEHGVTHFANGLTGGPRGVPAIPHYPLKRACLEQRSILECKALLQSQPVCSSGNMVLADGTGAVADIEISPESCVQLSAEHSFNGSMLHTNHFLDPKLSDKYPPLIADSLPRLIRLRSLVGLRWGDLTVDCMKRILADHGDGIEAGGAGECQEGGCICRHGLGAMDSVCGYIADVGTKTLHVRRGHGCTGHWVAYAL
jgi:isopenicillin-N N-acyltransferase-like protein